MSRRHSLAEELRRTSGTVVSGDDFAELALLHAAREEGSRYGSVASENDGSCGDGKLLLEAPNDNKKKDRRLSLIGETELLQDELKATITLAIPIISTYLLELIPGIVTIILVGRADHGSASLTQLYLDAAALANMWVNITALSTGFGILSAMDTLCASAVGAKQYSKMGGFLLTGLCIISAVFGLVSVVVWKTDSALLFLRQPVLPATYAGTFARWMLPGIPFLYAYEIVRKMTQARGQTKPMVAAAIVSNIVNAGAGYYLVNFTEMKWLGAAAARTLGSISLLPTMLIVLYYSEEDESCDISTKEWVKHVWSGMKASSALTRKAIYKFLSLGIPGMAMLMFEWVAFEVVALLCGIIPGEHEAIVAIGSNAIVFNISSLLYMVYLGTSISGNIRLGTALGSGDVERATIASYITIGLGMSLSLLNMAVLLSFRQELCTLFTSDMELIEKSKSLLLVVALYQFPDAVNAVEQGVYQASGRQALGAKLNFIAYYIIGLPLAYLLAIPFGAGVGGLWFGMTIGLCFIASINTFVILRSDWRTLSMDARKRLSMSLPRES